MCVCKCVLVLIGVLHMAGVAESTVARLGSTLVEAHLQVELTLVGAQLLLGEGTLVLFGHLGSQSGASELGMLLRLIERVRERGVFKVDTPGTT